MSASLPVIRDTTGIVILRRVNKRVHGDQINSLQILQSVETSLMEEMLPMRTPTNVMIYHHDQVSVTLSAMMGIFILR